MSSLNLKTSKTQKTTTMSVKSILSGYGLYDDLIGIIDDYTVGTKEDFKQRYSDVLHEMTDTDFCLEQNMPYHRSYGMFENVVESLLFRSVYEYTNYENMYGCPGDYWNERSCIPLRDWDLSLYDTILLDKLQKKIEKFIKVFPHIMNNKELSYVDCTRLTDLLKQPIHRFHYRTHDIQYFVYRLRNRDTKCRLYFDSISFYSHIEFDKIENFPELKIQFQLNQCLYELKNNYNAKRKKQLEKERELRLEQHKKFFVGWKYIPYSLGGTDITFTITRMTPRCIYYTKTQNGIESEPKRKLIKTTEGDNGLGGIQYFCENKKSFKIKATYIIQ